MEDYSDKVVFLDNVDTNKSGITVLKYGKVVNIIFFIKLKETIWSGAYGKYDVAVLPEQCSPSSKYGTGVPLYNVVVSNFGTTIERASCYLFTNGVLEGAYKGRQKRIEIEAPSVSPWNSNYTIRGNIMYFTD